MLLITFHGGAGGINNMGAYLDDGTCKSDAVLSGAPDVSELRGLGLVADGLLWVLSGGKQASEILAFTGGGDSYTYAATVAAYGAGSGLLHPFDFTLDDLGNAYVS